jgi:tetratricopeptide (TPR) repeat protein
MMHGKLVWTMSCLGGLVVACVIASAARGYINAGFRSEAEQREAERLGIPDAADYYAYKLGASLQALRDNRKTEQIVRDAMRRYHDAVASHEDDPLPRYQRGSKYWELYLWKEAEADFEEAIRLDPKFGRAYYRRAMARWRRDLHAQAISDYENAIALEPRFAPAYLRAALAYAARTPEKLRDPGKALKLAERACELTEYQDAVCLRVLATVHALSGNTSEAVKWQTMGLELIPKDEEQAQRRARRFVHDVQRGQDITPDDEGIDRVRSAAGNKEE